MTTSDPLDDLDSVLNLEEGFYAEGFALGQKDGRQAGLVEGRAVGLQRGFERFATMGKLHGRSVVWHSRLKSVHSQEVGTLTEANVEVASSNIYQRFITPSKIDCPANNEHELMQRLEAVKWLPLPQNPRLPKHIQLLYGLSEPESLSMENKEEDVAEFDDRFRRASGKAGITGKIVGEQVNLEAVGNTVAPAEGSERGTVQAAQTEIGIEDVDILKVRH